MTEKLPHVGTLACLSLGVFAVGTDGFVITGVLPQMASSLNVSNGQVGLLITVFAVVYAIAAPLLSVYSAHYSRKRLLPIALLVFTLANVAGAVAPNYALLMLARIIAALSAASFTAPALGATTQLVPESARGRAMAIVAGGFALATLLGVPLGAAIGNALNWRWTFGMVAAVGLCVTVAIALTFPNLPLPETPTLRQRLMIITRKAVLGTLAINAIACVGSYVAFTYIALIITSQGFHKSTISLVLLAYGIACVSGAVIAGKMVDHRGSDYTLGLSLIVVAVVQALLAGLIALDLHNHAVSMFLLVILLLTWGVAGFIFPPAQQHRLARMAPDAPAVALSFNATSIYLGAAIGAASGAAIVDRASLAWVCLISALCMTTAFICLQFAPGPTKNGAS